MKLIGVLAAWSALTVVAPAPVAAADLCDYAELPVQLGDLVEPAFKCQTASGYSFVTPSTLPTDAEVAKICAQCAEFITTALAPDTKLPACQLVLDSGSAVTVSNFFQGIASKCASNATTASPAASGSSSASTAAPARVVPVIPIVTTPPSSDPPATAKPPTTVSPPKSQSTTASSKSPSTSPSGETDASEYSDDTGSDRSEARTEINDSKSGDDDSSPDSTDTTPTSDQDSQEDPASAGSPSKSKSTSTTTVATKTSHATGVAHAGLASVATALMAASLVALRA